jgi:hypothetical protein
VPTAAFASTKPARLSARATRNAASLASFTVAVTAEATTSSIVAEAGNVGSCGT